MHMQTMMRWVLYMSTFPGVVVKVWNCFGRISCDVQGYVPDPNVMVYPAEELRRYIYTSRSYGILHLAADPDYGHEVFLFQKLQSPDQEFIIGDSTVSEAQHATLAFAGYQIHKIQAPYTGGSWGIHFRHNNRAGALYADGHVKAVTPRDVKALRVPIRSGYDRDRNEFNF